MNQERSVGSPHPGGLSFTSFREAVKDVARYWERRRVGYNTVLFLITKFIRAIKHCS